MNMTEYFWGTVLDSVNSDFRTCTVVKAVSYGIQKQWRLVLNLITLLMQQHMTECNC